MHKYLNLAHSLVRSRVCVSITMRVCISVCAACPIWLSHCCCYSLSHSLFATPLGQQPFNLALNNLNEFPFALSLCCFGLQVVSLSLSLSVWQPHLTSLTCSSFGPSILNAACNTHTHLTTRQTSRREEQMKWKQTRFEMLSCSALACMVAVLSACFVLLVKFNNSTRSPSLPLALTRSSDKATCS